MGSIGFRSRAWGHESGFLGRAYGWRVWFCGCVVGCRCGGLAL